MRPDEVPPALIASILHAALHRSGQITIRLATIPTGDKGRCNYRDGTIYADHTLDPAALRSTVVHELIHLARGPAHGRHRHVEEIIVEHTAAEALIPQAAALAALHHQWTNREVETLAAAFGVDEALMHEVVDPQTMPIMIPVPRDA